MLTFDNFEQEIDSEILERGQQYYKSGKVQDLEEISDGVWRAIVLGGEDYDVEIEDSPEGLLCGCTCPYEWGPYCKHVAATLYAIRAETKGGKPRQTQKQRQRQTINTLINRLTREQLIEIVSEQVKKDKMLANDILLKYGETAPGKATYAQIVKNSLREGTDRDGFIDYYSSHRATKGLYDLLAKAEKLIAAGEAAKALPMLQAVIEEATPALQYSDDSDGYIGGAIEQAFDYLEDTIPALNPADRAASFEYCLSEAFQPKYQGWDWRWSFLEAAAELVHNADERAVLFEALDRMASQRKGNRWDFYTEYDEEQAAALKLAVIEKQDSSQQIHEFLLQNVHLHRMRERLAHLYIEQKQYAAARKLCMEAIQLYRRDKPGLVRQYQKILLDLDEREGKSDNVIELAAKMLLDGYEFDPYYATLKRTVPAKQWSSYVETLIQRIQKETVNRWIASNTLREIYFREGMWDRLLELAGDANGTADVLHRHGDELEKKYPDEMCAIYEKLVYNAMARASSRDQYRTMCAYLKRIKKLGQPERAKTIAETLKNRYPKRRAMIEELSKV
jgi:uncharacterized Zn finger protein